MKLLFHQIWNQRKLNSWIFLELLIVSCFLWITIDPLFVIVSNRAIPTGMNLDRVYYVRLDMAENIPQDIEYKKIVDMFHHELNTVKELPEIEDFCVMDESSEICGRMWNGAQMFSDTTDIAKDKEDRTSKYVHGQSFSFPANYGDLCQLYGMTDAVSGKPFVLPKNAGGKVVISESAAKLFFGKTNVVGRSYYHGNKKQVEVCGVVKDIKYSSFSQPYPTEIEVTQEVDHNRYMYELGFRLKEGVDSKEFKRRFEKDVMPKMKTEVFSCSGLYDVDENIQLRNKFSGHINKMRLQSVLIGFALLSIFLGMLGTFWMRCNARRAEIGLMRSIGASKRNITNRCLLEAAILTTIAFVLIVPVMYLYADANGFYMIDEKLIENGQLSTDYPQTGSEVISHWSRQ